MDKVRWGILSTAAIGRERVIPAMQASEFCVVVAVASRNKERAQMVANRLNIPKAYGSYEELLNDDNIDAVYIPLPNHLHVPWAIKAIQANKHVLCEKPIGLSSAEAGQLLEAARQKPHLKLMEAFMYRFHPQWTRVKKLVTDGTIGELKTIQSFFSYYNTDKDNIRNQKDLGGGSMLHIGCYCVSMSRYIFGKEPERVLGIVEYDQELCIDCIASGILDFTTGTSTFTCSTQLAPFQRVNILGTEARIEIEVPFSSLPDEPTHMRLRTKSNAEEIVFDAVDQYTLQSNLFSRAVLSNIPLPVSPEDALHNMRAIECIFQSSEEGTWKKLLIH